MAAERAAADGDPPALAELLAEALPGASAAQLDYTAAMLQPFGAAAADTAGNAGLLLEELTAAASEAAAAEERLAERSAPEALRCLRQAAAALGSRSLDMASAFAVVQGGRLPLPQLVRRSGVGCDCGNQHCLPGG